MQYCIVHRKVISHLFNTKSRKFFLSIEVSLMINRFVGESDLSSFLRELNHAHAENRELPQTPPPHKGEM